jgi:hypothetical protein
VQAATPIAHQAGEPLRVPFESPADAAPGDAVAIQIGGYDVTGFARFDGATLQIELPTPLAPGQHELRILLLRADGGRRELLLTRLDVRAAARPRPWSIDSALDLHHRLTDNPAAAYVGDARAGASGGVSGGIDHERAGWRLTASADVAYDANVPAGADAWALPAYRFAVSRQDELPVTVALGSIRIAREDLLFSSYARRGLSIDLGDTDGAYLMRLFRLQPEPTTRIDGELGLPDDEAGNSTGLTLDLAPWGERLQLGAAYVDGETALAGAGNLLLGPPTRVGGDGWNVSLSSVVRQGSVRLAAEYAQSRFDGDGLGVGDEARQDDARQASLSLNSDGALRPGPFDYWLVDLLYRSVGSDFYSLTNLTLPGDLETTQFLAQSGRGGLALSAEWTRERGNVEDDPLRPTQTLRRQGLALNYTPLGIDPERGPWRWLGTPSLDAQLYRSRYSQPDSDALVVGYDLDTRSDEAQANATFSRPTWNWSLQWQRFEQRDRSDVVIINGYLLHEPGSDLVDDLLGLQLAWNPWQRLSLSGFVQHSELEETAFDNVYRSRNYGLDVHIGLVPQRVDLALSYNLATERSVFAEAGLIGDDLRSHFLSGRLNWHALLPRADRAGLDVNLRGQYGRRDDRAFGRDTDRWAVHLGVQLRWKLEQRP